MINSKKTLSRLLTFLIVLQSVFVISCQNEGMDYGDQTNGVSNNDGNDVDNSNIFNADGTLNINTNPSSINLEAVENGEVVDVEGRIDLNGQTVSLPSNITLNYAGGEIINGTLNFSTESIIDANLLNNRLALQGHPMILSDEFIFRPGRWKNIVQGNVDYTTALNNTKNFEALIYRVKEMGASIFKMGTFDAYFEVSTVTSTTSNQNFYPQKEAINIPSDFTLQMSDDTILRVFPTGDPNISPALIGIDAATNSTVIGGVLYGDRDLISYSSSNQETGALLMMIKSGKNIVIDGVTFMMSSRTAFTMNSYGFTFQPDYDPTDGILVKNCTFDTCRGQSLTLTDARNVIIENNTFINTGQPTQFSDGGVVGFAMNFEPIRQYDNGQLVWYQYVENVIVQNNTEYGSRSGSCSLYAGNLFTVQNNNFEKTTTWVYVTNSKIKNNTFIAAPNSVGSAILAGGSGDTVYNNEISGNTIQNYTVGISANHKLYKIFDNTITDCATGVQFKNVSDIEVYNNTITGSSSSSKGFMGHISSMDNIEIYNNSIDVVYSPIYIVQVNKEVGQENFRLNIHDNQIVSTSKCTFSNSNGINFTNNTLNSGIQLMNTSEITVENNTINTSNSHGINLMNANYDIHLENNNITTPPNTNYQCINIQSSTNTSEVVQTGNTCL